MRADNTWRWLCRKRDIGGLKNGLSVYGGSLPFGNLKTKFSNNMFLAGHMAEPLSGPMIQGIHDGRDLVLSHFRERLFFQEG